MRRDDLTLIAFGPMFRRLLLAHQRQIPAADLDGTIEVYFETVQRFSETVVSRAVEQLIREPGRFFPKAGELRATCQQYEGERTRQLGHQHHANDDHRCGGCGQPFYVAGYERPGGEILARLRCACPPPGPGWHTLAAKAYRETKPGANMKAVAA